MWREAEEECVGVGVSKVPASKQEGHVSVLVIREGDGKGEGRERGREKGRGRGRERGRARGRGRGRERGRGGVRV